MAQPFDFLTEYLTFNAGNECPRNYHIWSALTILAGAVHKRVYVPQGYFTTYPNLFVGLIGDMGSRKSTAKDIASDLFQEAFPDYPILASVQSREDIVKYMNSDACLFLFKDEKDTEIKVRPIMGFINELKNFLSVDPGKMVEFLTDIYNTKRFKSGTIKRGLEDLENPCVNLICCETPEWITDKMKGKIISGGWSRRIIYVYETDRAEPIPFPQRPEGHAEMWARLKNHLVKVSTATGPFEWGPDAKEWYAEWYSKMRRNMPDDKIMAGYYESKHDQLLKVAMLLALSHESMARVITKRNLELGLAMLDALEKNMPKLSQAAGRNELNVPIQFAMELLEKKGGMIPEKAFRRILGKEMSPMEVQQVIRFMKETDQIVQDKVKDVQEVVRDMIMLPSKHKELKEQQQKKKAQPNV